MIAQLLRDPTSMGSKKGLIAGFIYWASPFPKLIETIKFILLRGPEYGYSRLNMKKCVYLMAPSAHSLSDDEVNDEVQLQMSLDLSIDNIKIFLTVKQSQCLRSQKVFEYLQHISVSSFISNSCIKLIILVDVDNTTISPTCIKTISQHV